MQDLVVMLQVPTSGWHSPLIEAQQKLFRHRAPGYLRSFLNWPAMHTPLVKREAARKEIPKSLGPRQTPARRSSERHPYSPHKYPPVCLSVAAPSELYRHSSYNKGTTTTTESTVSAWWTCVGN